ncbi:HPr kinase [Pontixanthobacter gangjinensis]|uniref:Hpr(Ser) kinase/phosphatase n=1 Tax=Pontixanthobacter gangjinensis TaxID=1028742 RepID=A0A6I4SQQ7_9SPHN|nr:hypothetical protein [Pontixanthobacter gangjinensis]MXO57490.1 hypothetical protein [Pontixanthobacter gangjinensis]
MTGAAIVGSEKWFGYRHSGVLIASGFEVPEWLGFAETFGDEATDIKIEIGTAGLEPIPSDQHGVYDGGCMTFSEPLAGRWSICDGKKIIVEPISVERMTEARLYTLGSAWGALGYQRGWAMLHGSAVQIGAKTALFAGEANQGKSTIAAALTRAGARLLSDDLSRVRPPSGNDGTQLWPSGARLKLWEEALNHFGLQHSELVQDHFRDQKFHLAVDQGPIDAAPVPLSAVFVLEWRDTIAVERLRGSEAVRALADATMYRKEYLELMGKLGEQVVHCARIAAQVPIYRVTRPRDFMLLDEVCDRVSLSLSDL